MLKYAVLSTISMIKERNYDLYLEIKQECTDKHKELNFDSLIVFRISKQPKITRNIQA